MIDNREFIAPSPYRYARVLLVKLTSCSQAGIWLPGDMLFMVVQQWLSSQLEKMSMASHWILWVLYNYVNSKRDISLLLMLYVRIHVHCTIYIVSLSPPSLLLSLSLVYWRICSHSPSNKDPSTRQYICNQRGLRPVLGWECDWVCATVQVPQGWETSDGSSLCWVYGGWHASYSSLRWYLHVPCLYQEPKWKGVCIYVCMCMCMHTVCVYKV